MIEKKLFGILEDGQEVYNFTLSNQSGMSVTISAFGGTVVSIRVPDRFGRVSDVVAGYDSLGDYVLGNGYLGALVGRTANRIAGGRFLLDGVTYCIGRNNDGNSLHGGNVGFSHRVWEVEPIDGEEPKLLLKLRSPDGEEGYPGNLDVTVTYTLTHDMALAIRYEAVTDRRTPVAMTNHTYFNLGGYASGKIFDHVLQMEANAYLPTDKELIPTGEIRSVNGTPFDFRDAKLIGADIDADDEDLKLAGGYDHCFCFVGGATEDVKLRIVVFEPESGRMMRVFTNQPCVQFYTANSLNNPLHPLKGGYPQTPHTAFCLETQTMPDSVNHQNFTNTILTPGETYLHETVYQFSVNQ